MTDATNPTPGSTPNNRGPGEPPAAETYLDLIAQEARVTRARLLPTERKLTDDEILAVREEATRFLSYRGHSGAWLSRQLGDGFGPTSVTQWLKGTYTGDVDAFARAINAKIATLISAERVKMPEEFVRTAVAERILAAIKQAHDHRGIAEITGDSGYGKTITLKAAQAIYPGSAYIRINTVNRNAHNLLGDIFEEVTGRGAPTRFGLQYSGVIGTLKGTSRVLLIDEAHMLSASGRGLLRDILDEAEVGVVLAGNDDISAMLDRERSQRRGQFASRVVARCRFDRADSMLDGGGSTASGGMLFTADDIVKMFSRSQLRLTGDGAQMLAAIASLPESGALRLCRQIAVNILSLPDLAAKPITAKTVRQVLRAIHPVMYERIKDVRPEREQQQTRRAASA